LNVAIVVEHELLDDHDQEGLRAVAVV